MTNKAVLAPDWPVYYHAPLPLAALLNTDATKSLSLLILLLSTFVVSTSFTFLLRRTKQKDTDVTVVTVRQFGGCHSSYITGQIVTVTLTSECHASLLCSAPARGDSQLVWFRHVKARKA